MSKHTNDITLRSLAELTGADTTYSNDFRVDRYDELILFLYFSAQGMYTNETINVTVQVKDPDGNFIDLTNAAFTQVGNATGSVPYLAEYLAIAVFGSRIRLKYVTTGTTVSYTFSVKAIGKGDF